MKSQQYGATVEGFQSYPLVKMSSFDMGSYSFGKPRKTQRLACMRADELIECKMVENHKHIKEEIDIGRTIK